MTQNSFYFLRHGETDWNLTGQLQGHQDVALNAQGMQQAYSQQKLVQSQPIGAVWHSDLGRAVQTAQIVCADQSWPLTPTPQLRPPNFGSNTSLTPAEIKANYAKNPDNYVLSVDNFPYAKDGELSEASYARITNFVINILAITTAPPLFIAHGEMFRALTLSWQVNAPNISSAKNCQPYYFYQQGCAWHCREITHMESPTL